jgi:hypothetical protein
MEPTFQVESKIGSLIETGKARSREGTLLWRPPILKQLANASLPPLPPNTVPCLSAVFFTLSAAETEEDEVKVWQKGKQCLTDGMFSSFGFYGEPADENLPVAEFNTKHPVVMTTEAVARMPAFNMKDYTPPAISRLIMCASLGDQACNPNEYAGEPWTPTQCITEVQRCAKLSNNGGGNFNGQPVQFEFDRRRKLTPPLAIMTQEKATDMLNGKYTPPVKIVPPETKRYDPFPHPPVPTREKVIKQTWFSIFAGISAGLIFLGILILVITKVKK